MKLGPFEIDHPFVLAPMAGITHSPFRRLMRRHGASLVVSELVSANGLHYGGEKTLELLRFNEEERPIGLQIFGEDADRFAEAAKKVETFNATFVDLNFGCPVPKVVNKGGGSAMMRDPVLMAKILTAVVAAVKIPVSIKIRTGWDSASVNALEIARIAEECGIVMVAIHGRTRAQGYSGLADWDVIGNVKAKVRIPILGNGDVTTPEIALDRWKTYGVDAVMIGRGVLRNPFLFEQCVAHWKGQSFAIPTPDQYLILLEELKIMYAEFFNPHYAFINSKKFLAWFSSGFPGCHEFRRKVFASTQPEELWAEALRFFSENTSGRDWRFLNEPFLTGGHG